MKNIESEGLLPLHQHQVGRLSGRKITRNITGGKIKQPYLEIFETNQKVFYLSISIRWEDCQVEKSPEISQVVKSNSPIWRYLKPIRRSLPLHQHQMGRLSGRKITRNITGGKIKQPYLEIFETNQKVFTSPSASDGKIVR